MKTSMIQSHFNRLSQILTVLLALLAVTWVPQCVAAASLDHENRIVTYYTDDNRIIRVVRTYPSKRAARLGYYKTVTTYDQREQKEKVERYFTEDVVKQKGFIKVATIFSTEGEAIRVEQFYSEQAKQLLGVDKMVEVLARPGKRSAPSKIIRYASDEEYALNGELRKVEFLNSEGKKTKEEHYYVIDKSRPDQILKIVLRFDTRERLMRKETYYPDPNTNSLGYYQSIFHYDKNGNKKIEEWFLTQEMAEKDGIRKQKYFLNPRGSVVAQETCYSSDRASMQGFTKRIFHFDAKGRKEKEERTFNDTIQKKHGWAREVVFFDTFGYATEVKTFDAGGQLVKISNVDTM